MLPVKRLCSLLVVLALVLVALGSTVSPEVQAQAPDEPSSVTLVGSVAEALGCVADDATCEAAQLSYDPDDLVWQAVFDLPAGDYTYNVALDGGEPVNIEPVTFTLEEDDTVKFYYDHRVGWAADDASTLIANLPGTLQGPIGCPLSGGNEGNWQPDCLRTLLTDVDSDGIFTYFTNELPEGRYEVKVAYNETWGENYGVGGNRDGANITFNVIADNNDVLFEYDPESHLLEIETELPPPGDLSLAQAQWILTDQIAWEVPFTLSGTYRLHWDPAGDMELADDGTGVVGGESIELTYASDRVNSRVIDQRPYLDNKAVLELDAGDLDKVPEILRSQIVVSLEDEDGVLVDATNMQIPLVLDDLYFYDGELGVSWEGEMPTVRVWAPTARSVTLHIFDDATAEESTTFDMTYDDVTGVWSVTGDADWKNKYYLFEVEVYVPATGQVEHNLVTDPYSFSLSTNSQRSQLVDLSDLALMPEDWTDYEKPELVAPEDIAVYELHVRDFSIYDESVSEEFRGKFMAFTQSESNGVLHLAGLADAGLTHLHMLPVFDIATINEDPEAQVGVDPIALAEYGPASPEPQAQIFEIRDEDGFNWGYDPYHYTVPEGSYSTDPNGAQRILEFREMVRSLNGIGLRVVMDVVYNHTNDVGQGPRSVLDKIVPGYYYRLNPGGAVETSTCCPNTATEHRMMEKLMIDSVLTWATAYKVDGFRFDLMGHHMVENMVNVRAALDALTVEEDGVDGSKIYVYGEGWNFGEVADGARGLNATQLNIGGVGIGTFNDRLRDAVRGGNPFGAYQEQGFINGLYTNPNGITPGTEEEQLARLLLFADQIRVGLAGNLRDYTLINREGNEITGADVDYNGSPAGYTLDPQEHIVYVSAHDNETLFDAIQYKAPADATIEERGRMQNMGISIVAMSQGVPFFHAGIDMLRSKSFDKDSYNSGDWFNALDFTYNDNGWGHGLPVADKNETQWPIQEPLLENQALAPSHENILFSVEHMREMLRIRKSSGLFRLQTADEIQQNVSFLNTGPNQVPGIIVMELVNSSGLEAEPYSQIVVVFNPTNEAIDYAAEGYEGLDMMLHPIQQESIDEVVRTASFADGTFSVPAYTTAVFAME